MELVISCQLISVTFSIIKQEIYKITGADAAIGINFTIGARIMTSMKHIATVIAVRPVLPCDFIPAMLSKNGTVGEVPNILPNKVA